MNNNPTSEELTFLKLIRTHKIEIPIIQRDYAQGREENADIRNNFLDALRKAVTGNSKLELDFIYGSVKDNVLQPLDGQQRLTTLFLLHWYISIKENKLDDELKKSLSNFTYETRASSREFCNDLVKKSIDWNKLLPHDKNEKNEISKTITNSSWFSPSWKRDPTIKAMLTMLDAIHKKFEDGIELWDKLKNITFQYIELQNFGLSDDLYIKMNARGKPLTPFENFKAKFEQLIKQDNWENGVELTDTFAYKIDTVWADLFWHYRDKEKNTFDEQILNFFRVLAINNYAIKGDIEDDKFEDNIYDLLIDPDPNISFLEYFDKDCFESLKSVLNKISDKNGLKKFLTDTTYVDENKVFNSAIGKVEKVLGYADLVILFAFYQYLALEENIETEKFDNWMRIVRNLVEGSRPYFHQANFVNALRSIKNKLLKHRNYIVKHFSEARDNYSLSGFIGEQVKEEKLKAKLFTQSDDWKKAIIEIENHKYFNGQIGFLLHWCEIKDKPDLNRFKQYAEKSKAIFGDKGLNEFDHYLFERALLATGDYLLEGHSNLSFLIDSHRDISWKRLLRGDRDEGNGREFVKQLIDKISVKTIKKDLQTIIDGFGNTKDWRYYFIKQPEMIGACGDMKLVYMRDGHIRLLKTKTVVGYNSEYYSYSLYIELRRKLAKKYRFSFPTYKIHGLEDTYVGEKESLLRYSYEIGRESQPHLEYIHKKVAFDPDLKKHVWIKDTDKNWKKQKEENRGDMMRILCT